MNTTATNEARSAPPSALVGLLTIEDYRLQEGRERFFPAVESVRWYLRQHRAGLEECGALLRIQGRLWIQPDAFDHYVIEAGRKAAARSGATA